MTKYMNILQINLFYIIFKLDVKRIITIIII